MVVSFTASIVCMKVLSFYWWAFLPLSVGYLLFLVDEARERFMIDEMNTHHGLPRALRRDNIYQDVMDLYIEDADQLSEFPFRVRYENEKAIDTGGVCRDMFSAFWEKAYLKNFDGERLVVPCINPSISMDAFKSLGTILSHAYMSCGFMPIRIAFPVIASVLLGPDVDIPDSIVFESFVDFLSCHDSAKVKDALLNRNYFDKQVILSILSRYDCTEMPNAENVKHLIFGVARHVLLGKLLGNLYKMRAGVPTPFGTFWSHYTVSYLFTVYKSLNATSSSVLPLITEPMGMIEGFLTTFLHSYVT